MSTRANILGFLGIEAYDLMLYLTKLLYHLGKKVLLIDNSESGALTCCIPVPDTLNPRTTKISCTLMDFVKERNVTEYQEEYDYILMDFGFHTNHKELTNCSVLYLITDRQQHNITRLQNLKSDHEMYVIIKDIVNGRFAGYLQECLKDKGLNIISYYSLFKDDTDKENMLGLQYSDKIKLRILSGQFRYVLNQLITETLCFSKTEAVEAYRKAKRGA